MAGGGSSQTVPVDLTPQAFQDLQSPFSSVLQGLLGTSGTDTYANIPTYSGPTAGTITPNEQATLNQLQDLTGPNAQGGVDQVAKDYYTQSVQGKYLENGTNPFLQSAIEAAQRPTQQALEETLSRTLPGRFTQAGQFVQPQGSSAFDRAAALATRDAGQTLADIATNMSFASYDAERNRQQDSAGALTTVSQQEVDNTLKNLQAQALPRLIQEYGIERGMQEYQTRVSAFVDLLKVVGATSSPTIANSSTSNQKPNLVGLL